MASLIEVRDLLALQGRMDATQLSQILRTPQAMIEAMLERLEAYPGGCRRLLIRQL